MYHLRWFGAKFGLANTFKLAELAGNPQRKLRFVHVAGTNGKGSTCAMLESVYRAAGLRVGLFTSPHLVAFGERIQVNRHPIGEAEVARLAAELRLWVEQFPQADHPTFFEVVTIMALRHFAAQQCDVVVWETGLGGRLDATNIVTPLASVITNIQFDHQQWLGETLADIASEKAGIIKPGVPVITGTEAPEALDVIAAKAREQNAPLTIITPADAQRPPLDSVNLPLLGRHQRANAAVAVAVVRALARHLPVSESKLSAGLSRVRWAGRLQLATLPSGQKLLLDGAHNVGGAEMLASALEEYFPSAKPALVLGILRDKDWAAMCRILAPLAGRILLCPVHSERTAEPRVLAEACRRANPQVAVSEFPSLAAALADTAREGFVTVAGSLYLIGEAMELLHLSPAKAGKERGLNEWSGGRLSAAKEGV
ncbi:MAG: bifunctional folylpolyglutamate synthase/dihydrofolate synthase [Limisphaerales bacterium]